MWWRRLFRPRPPVAESIAATYGDDVAGFLLRHCGSLKHTEEGVTLLEHLHNTAALLRQWECSRTLQLAGLLHSIYSTVHFTHAVVARRDRDNVRSLVGDDVEDIVYAFCAMDRPQLYAQLDTLADETTTQFVVSDRWQPDRGDVQITRERYLDLYTLMSANWFEQRQRITEPKRRMAGPSEWTRIAPYLSPAAQLYIMRELQA